MKNFFIPHFTLLLLALNGNMIGMHHVAKNLASKSYRAYSVSLTLNNGKFTDHNKNNAPEINSKDHENKQGHYILNYTFNGHEDKMAYYKQWQQRS